MSNPQEIPIIRKRIGIQSRISTFQLTAGSLLKKILGWSKNKVYAEPIADILLSSYNPLLQRDPRRNKEFS